MDIYQGAKRQGNIHLFARTLTGIIILVYTTQVNSQLQIVAVFSALRALAHTSDCLALAGQTNKHAPILSLIEVNRSLRKFSACFYVRLRLAYCTGVIFVRFSDEREAERRAPSVEKRRENGEKRERKRGKKK